MSGLALLFPAITAGPLTPPPLRMESSVSKTSPLECTWELWQEKQFISRSGLISLSNLGLSGDEAARATGDGGGDRKRTRTAASSEDSDLRIPCLPRLSLKNRKNRKLLFGGGGRIHKKNKD